MVLTQKLHEAFKGTVERITGPRTVSAFKEKGVLSVSEFVIAGDNLVSKCPTWSWYLFISLSLSEANHKFEELV
jgi:ubiquitin-like-conjugating enzyme ATG3